MDRWEECCPGKNEDTLKLQLQKSNGSTLQQSVPTEEITALVPQQTHTWNFVIDEDSANVWRMIRSSLSGLASLHNKNMQNLLV